MVSKDCKDYDDDCETRRCYRVVFGCLAFTVLLILFTILVIFLALQPKKPKFTLKDTTIYQFNFSNSDNYHITTTMQVTLSSYNPNNRIGIYYDKLDVYADYKSQQITIPSAITAVYQGHDDVTVWSPFLYGVDVPVAPDLCVMATQDQTAGLVLIHVRVNGKLRWKVGSWISGHYHIHVTCPAFLTVDNTIPTMPTFRFQQITGCTVDV